MPFCCTEATTSGARNCHSRHYYLGIDIGGTFTDAVLMDHDGMARLYKTPTTPTAPANGVRDAIALAENDLGVSAGSLLQEVAYFGLGTTVATNALIERTGVTTGLITTRGFGDSILMQRGMGAWVGLNPEEVTHYARRRLPAPLVPRPLIEEVVERVDYKGTILTPLDEADARRAVAALLDRGVEAIAVCLLWSFRDPSHERRIRHLIREAAPDVYVSLSSDLAPVLGEYERTATAAMNAYLGPSVSAYMRDLDGSLRERGFAGVFRIMDSGGGVITPERCGNEPVSILTSGPTGGVLASRALAERLGTPNVLTTDMGGTSFDAGLIVDYAPIVSPRQEVAQYHVLKPAIKVTAIGAGGGSIARVVAGQLFVGPSSAGATPGPVSYGRGGTSPTVTDADVVLGIIDPHFFLGGTFALDREAAERAIHDQIARPLGLTVEEAAAGIKQITDHRMADLLETLTIGQGYDPRDFVLFAYGGAGPTHCHVFGAELGVQSMVIPATATVHSALGAVTSDLHVSAELSDLMHAPSWEDASSAIDIERINANYARLEDAMRQALLESGASPDRITSERFADMRLRMQVHQLMVPVDPGVLAQSHVGELFDRFHTQFEALYGSGAAHKEAGVEIVSFRVRATGDLDKPLLAHRASTRLQAQRQLPDRTIYLGGTHGPITAAVLSAEALATGDLIEGPAVIEHPGTTIFVGPGQAAGIDNLDNTVITFDREERRA